ncbi:MAG: TetR family transcriptional regulator [Nocardioides sp.]|nr:TetR family transcriptional regulator [Nocardioides sp.]
MATRTTSPSARETALLELAWDYVLGNGVSDLSLRPLASAIGSSPRVLLFLFGSKEELVRRLLARARREELEALAPSSGDAAGTPGLAHTTAAVWDWLSQPEHGGLLRLWLEAYARSVSEPGGVWDEFARGTVEDWLGLLTRAQPPAVRRTTQGRVERTLALAVLRGALIDLLATGDRDRVDGAVRSFVATLT